MNYRILWVCAAGFAMLIGLAVTAKQKLRRSCQDTFFLFLGIGLDCSANNSLAVACADDLIDATRKSGDSKFSLAHWERDLKLNSRFSEAYENNSTFRFTLNEGTLYDGYENVDVLFFLSDGKLNLDWGGRDELWGYDDDFVKLEDADQVFKSKESYTMIITSDLKLEAMPVRKALKLRWKPSEPHSAQKVSEMNAWDDTKFNGGRKYESERD